MKPQRRDYAEYGECDCEAFQEDLEAWGEAKYEQMRDEQMERGIEDEREELEDLPGK